MRCFLQVELAEAGQQRTQFVGHFAPCQRRWRLGAVCGIGHFRNEEPAVFVHEVNGELTRKRHHPRRGRGDCRIKIFRIVPDFQIHLAHDLVGQFGFVKMRSTIRGARRGFRRIAVQTPPDRPWRRQRAASSFRPVSTSQPRPSHAQYRREIGSASSAKLKFTCCMVPRPGGLPAAKIQQTVGRGVGVGGRGALVRIRF